jgi:hypothetical protein
MSNYLPVNSSDPGWRRRAERYVPRLRRRRPDRYSRECSDESQFVTLGELHDELGDEVAGRLATHFYHCDFEKEPIIERTRLADLIELLAERHSG